MIECHHGLFVADAFGVHQRFVQIQKRVPELLQSLANSVGHSIGKRGWPVLLSQYSTNFSKAPANLREKRAPAAPLPQAALVFKRYHPFLALAASRFAYCGHETPGDPMTTTASDASGATGAPARAMRVISIDVLRGLVMFTMIFVNDLAGAHVRSSRTGWSISATAIMGAAA